MRLTDWLDFYLLSLASSYLREKVLSTPATYVLIECLLRGVQGSWACEVRANESRELVTFIAGYNVLFLRVSPNLHR